ncbi:MAG: hypothetical protein NT066_00550 [Candidatus Omnitrophica bacterium]|nr:hypothetical protein [Candidatus Omnitrophota bacterium]
MRDKYFLADLVLTFLLLFFTTFLVKEALAGYWLYFILILICGFCFSLFFKDRQDQLIRIFITIGTFLALAWMARSILNSSFFYKDVIAICIKGSLILEIILSFNLYWPKYLNYMQALSCPVFMCFPLVVKGSNEASIIAILGYFICWLVILKVKFYEFLKVQRRYLCPKDRYRSKPGGDRERIL